MLPRYPTKYFITEYDDISREESPDKDTNRRRNNLRQGFRDLLSKRRLWWENFSKFA